MKIFLINPDYGMTEKQLAQRCRILQAYVSANTELHMECLQNTQLELSSELDASLAAPEIISMAVAAEKNGYDAVVLYCFSDPACAACREAVSIPVVGGAQAALLLAPFLARQCGVLLADAQRIPEKKLFLAHLGLNAERISGIAGIDFRGIDPWQQREQALSQLEACGRRLMQNTGAQLLILGCLSFLGLAAPLSERLGIPVIDPAIAAVSAAESLVRQKLATSRLAYPAPLSQRRSWSAGEIKL